MAPTDSDVTVNEKALDTTVTPPDLAAGTVTGSLPGSAGGDGCVVNQLNGSGGVGTLTYALVSGGNAATAGTFGTIQVNTDGSYVYTLTASRSVRPRISQRQATQEVQTHWARPGPGQGTCAAGG